MAEQLLTRVRVVGDHPHRGSAGTIVEGGAIRMKVGGLVMLKVKLDEGGECFAERPCLRPLPSSEDPYSPDSGTEGGR